MARTTKKTTKATKATKTAKAPVVEEVKTEVVETPVVEEVKEEVVETPVVEEVKEEVAETPVVEEEAKKAPAKKAAAKKATTKKAALTTTVTLQFADKSYTEESLTAIAKDVWTYDLNKEVAELKTVELYVKPEEGLCYYVFNGDVTGSFVI